MKAKILLYTILFSTLLLLSYFALIQQSTTTRLIVYAAGTSDQYGDRIVALWAEEWNSTSGRYQFPYGQCRHVITYDGSDTFDGFPLVFGSNVIFHSYADGFELRVYDNHPLKLYALVAVNKTLISNPLNETRMFLNISGVVDEEIFNLPTYLTTDNFYLLFYTYVWNATGQPNAGTTYNVALKYEVYY